MTDSGEVRAMSETASQRYDPIPDLAQLLCAAQRQPSPLGGITVPLGRLSGALGLPELAYPDEAEVALREAVAAAAVKEQQR